MTTGVQLNMNTCHVCAKKHDLCFEDTRNCVMRGWIFFPWVESQGLVGAFLIMFQIFLSRPCHSKVMSITLSVGLNYIVFMNPKEGNWNVNNPQVVVSVFIVAHTTYDFAVKTGAKFPNCNWAWKLCNKLERKVKVCKVIFFIRFIISKRKQCSSKCTSRECIAVVCIYPAQKGKNNDKRQSFWVKVEKTSDALFQKFAN